MAERKKRKRGPNLSVGRGEKLPVSVLSALEVVIGLVNGVKRPVVDGAVKAQL